MEGIILELEALASPWSILAGISLLAIVAGSILFGFMRDEEKVGRRLYWAEWPIPEADVPVHEHEEEFRLAA